MKRARLIWLLVLLVLAANVIAAGAFRFSAQNAYKPILLLNGACVLGLLALGNATEPRPQGSGCLGPSFLLLLSLSVVAAYFASFWVNFTYHDWTHRHIAADLNSWSAVGHLFTARQPDGMYRPLTFLSFWVDYRLFGSALWAYHLQSLVIHVADAVLVGLLAIRLGLGARIGRLAAWIFGLSAIHFEAVLWPAARFDLLAVLFSVIALLLFLAHGRTSGGRAAAYGLASLLSYAVAILTKETAYSLALLVPALIALGPFAERGWRRAMPYLAGLLSVTLVMFAIRFAIFKGVGGYAHSSVSLKSIYLLGADTLSLPLFGMNFTVKTSISILIAIVWAALAVAWGFLHRGSSRREKLVMLVLALLSAVPALSVIGWIQPSMLHTRHLYWPSAWFAIFLAMVLDETRRRRVFIVAFLLIQVAAMNYSVWVYRDALQRIDQSVEAVARSARGEALIAGVPDDPNGVICYIPELRERLAQGLPGVPFCICSKAADCGPSPGRPAVVFQWDAGNRRLVESTAR